MTKGRKKRDPNATRNRMIEAASLLMRTKGITATSIDEICTAAKVTKGAFFHHFKSKDAIVEAALEAWCRERVESYQKDAAKGGPDPLAQLHAILDGLIASAEQPPDSLPACLLGMVSQELAAEHQEMREICSSLLQGWTRFFTSLLKAAKEKHAPNADCDPEQFAWMLNSLWQGSLLIAKTEQNPKIVQSNFLQIRNWLDSIFQSAGPAA